MDENRIVVTQANDGTRSDEERWRTNLQRWNNFSVNQKWEAFFDNTLRFHNDFILTPAYTSPITEEINYRVPRRLQVRSEAAVTATRRYFATAVTTEYEEELREEYFRENGYPDSDDEDPDPDPSGGDVWFEIITSMSGTVSEEYLKFIDCLPFCVPIDIGSCEILRDTNPRRDREWLCPCSNIRFQNFRNMFNISDDLGWKCKSGVMNSYGSLRQHLIDKTRSNIRSNGDKVTHQIVRRFLQVKYEEIMY